MPPKKKISFEKALENLENIVNQLEEGELSLEKSLKLFEEGVAHLSHCHTELEAAELKVSKLTRKNGGFEKVPL